MAAAGGTGAIVAGCTVLKKNKKAAENAVQLASEKLDDKQKAFKRQGLLNFVDILIRKFISENNGLKIVNEGIDTESFLQYLTNNSAKL